MARRASSKSAKTVEENNASTLTRIREKELEFDGLVLIARSEAEKLVGNTSAEADRALKDAEIEAARLIAEGETLAISSAEAEAADITQTTIEQIGRLRHAAQSRRRATVEEIIRSTVGE